MRSQTQLELPEAGHLSLLAGAGLREREQQLSLFVEHAPAAIAMTDEHMRYIAVSRRFLSDYRIAGQNILGRSHYDIFPEIPDRWKEVHRRCLEGAVEKCEAEPFTRADGFVDWVRWEVRPWRTANDEIGGLMIFSEVITDRIQAEQARRNSEQLLKAVIDLIPHSIFAKDREGRHLFVNRACTEFTGLDPEHMVGRNDLDLLEDRRQAEQFMRDDRDVIESGRRKVIAEERLTDRNGESRILHTIKIPFEAPGAGPAILGVAVDISDLKRAEAALRQSEQQFRAVFELASIGMAQVNPIDKKWLRVNTQTCAITGYSAEELLQMRVTDITHPDDAQQDAEVLEKIRTGAANHFRVEKRYIRKDGTTVWVNVNISVVRDEEGRPLRTISTIEDVTERKRTADALRESEAKYRALIETTGTGYGILDQEGRVTDANDEYARLTGHYSVSEILGRSVNEWTMEADRERNSEEVQKCLESGSRRGLEMNYISRSGEPIPIEVNATLIETSQGKRILALCRDITARKHVEEQLRKLSHAVEQSPVSIVITNPAGTIEYVNPKFSQITGYSADESIGRNPRILKSGETSRENYRELWTTITSGREWRGEFHNRKKNGELFWELACISPILDERGNITHFVAIKEDITQRKQLETQLRQSQKMEAIGQLAGGVAHDFNNILCVIQGYGSLLLMDEVIPGEVTEAAKQILEAAERASNLTRQLLAFSRRQVMHPRLLDLNEVVTSLAKMLQRILGEDVRLQLSLAPHVLITRADPGMLDQVLMNLVVNARDAMPSGGRLTIETSRPSGSGNGEPNGFVCLRVSDTGCGISSENLSHIFEPFFTTKEVGKGTGLGLATVFGIVKQHNGSVSVQSRLLEGTTFEILLPAAEIEQPAAEKGPKRVKPKGGTETILLVEDEVSVRMLTRVLLERSGYTVLEAPDGVEALKVWEQNRNSIHLVLTDIVMPSGINGRELATRLQSIDPKLRVIFTTGYSADIAGREMSLEEGQNFIQKPSPPNHLLETIRKCLDS